MTWTFHHPRMTHEHLGLIPSFLIESDPRSAREQINEHYSHGGGWSDFKGFTLNDDNSITYSGDPPLPPRASLKFRHELVVVYDHAWVAIIQPDRTFSIARID